MHNPTQPIVDRDRILDFIPQKPPMAMIDQLFEATETTAVTGFEVRDSNILCENGELQSPALIENMAQTAAAHSGFLANQKGEKPPVGFIGAIKKMVVHKLPKVGSQLVSSMKITNVVMNFTMIQAEVKCEGELLAECQMNIFTQPNS